MAVTITCSGNQCTDTDFRRSVTREEAAKFLRYYQKHFVCRELKVRFHGIEKLKTSSWELKMF